MSGFIKNKFVILVFFLVSGIILYICISQESQESQEKTKNQKKRVYLASSLIILKDTLESQDKNLDLHFLSSSMIAQQVISGSPCDAMILADNQWQDYLERKLEHKFTKRIFATNSLVLAGYNLPKITNLDYLKNLSKNLSKNPGNKLIIADPDYVPLGRYSKQALLNLGLWDELKHKLILATSAHHARVLLEQKAGEYALLFKTDIRDRIILLTMISPKYYDQVEYSYLACKNSRDTTLKNLFFSSALRSALLKYNFGIAHE